MAAILAYDEGVLNPLSLMERYENDMGLIYVFEEIGLGNNERVRIINDGLNSIQEIVNQYGYDVKSFKTYLQNLNKTFANATGVNKVYYSPKTISELCGCLFYFNHCLNTLHIIPDVMQVDAVFLKDNDIHGNRLIKEANDEDSDHEDVDLPKLKGKENWTKFRDAFEANLSSTVGARGITIDYLIDDTTRTSTHGNALFEEYLNVDLEDEGLFKTQSVHFGEGYKSDNTKLWKRLKSCLLNTEPYAHISDFNITKNGRGAWKALLDMYQGSDYAERLKDSAFASLRQAHYRGETKNFGWEKYINIHKECHRKLVDAGYNNGKGMDEETKIHHLKANIRPEAGIEHVLTMVRTNPLYRNDFASLCSFIATEVDAKVDRSKQLKDTTHRVSGIKGGGKGNGNGGGHGKGKGNGRQGSSNDKRPSRFVDGKMVYGKFYPSKEFGALTKKQREAVIELKRAYQDGKNNGGNTNPTYSRGVKGLAAAIQDDITSLREDFESHLENRIVAAVQRGSAEGGDDSATRVTFDGDTSSQGTKRKAQSGSVGRFLAEQRKQKRDS